MLSTLSSTNPLMLITPRFLLKWIFHLRSSGSEFLGVVQESTSLSSISEKFWSSLKVENPYRRISISGPTQFLSSVPSPPLPHVPPTPPAVRISATLGARHKCHLPRDTFQDTPQVGQVHWNPSLTAPCMSLPALLPGEIQCRSAEKWYTAHLPRESALCKGRSLPARSTAFRAPTFAA